MLLDYLSLEFDPVIRLPFNSWGGHLNILSLNQSAQNSDREFNLTKSRDNPLTQLIIIGGSQLDQRLNNFLWVNSALSLESNQTLLFNVSDAIN